VDVAVLNLIGGPVLVVLGGLMVVFRKQYAAWQNRVRPPMRESQAFGPRLSILYGVMMVGAGINMAIFLGALRLHR
jgi:hypothetical protein